MVYYSVTNRSQTIAFVLIALNASSIQTHALMRSSPLVRMRDPASALCPSSLSSCLEGDDSCDRKKHHRQKGESEELDQQSIFHRKPDEKPATIERRRVLCIVCGSTFLAGCATSDTANAYTIRKGEPNEARIYQIAQSFRPSYISPSGKNDALRVLWIGAGNLKGVFKNLFLSGNEVLAVDLVVPASEDIKAASIYAKEHGYHLNFEQGDGTKLRFEDGAFDVVLSSQFLCQDFDPQVVVDEIYRVLKPRGRFGYFEDEEDIDKIIIGKVFGNSSVVEFEYDPFESNIIAGVVVKEEKKKKGNIIS